MISRIAHWIAICGPIGRAKFAPGSLGSLIGVFLAMLMGQHHVLFIAATVLVLVVGIWASEVTARDFKLHDPPFVVIDEVCGMMISLLFMPITGWTLLFGFIGFRIFDILKPPPLRLLERLPKGFGIVLDDVGAGIYTNLALQMVIRYAQL
ncbi:MAG: hypothetical protein A3C35_05865 [Omnitrophica bacterium RIFCSPHIGHO2_02_FULL_46_11]|nr:MAG: hypothetical protein A3C35_05865 [Omnitrophica bacterium RIFCSPHIGHO2_02_FULL_46_11]OGW86356.1 MAG: hypothetical protein A3A81_07740 [Omnitrophica bacterium RIFCSPLOWO2_01_FULL_45_10b]